MHPSSTRILTGICAAVLGACALSAAAPAQAETTTAPSGPFVVITKDSPAYSSPRLEASVVTDLKAGEETQGLCRFPNAGLEWVKVQADGLFGFVQSEVVEGATGLPRECPSELESIKVPAPGKDFATAAWAVPLAQFICPEPFPFLDRRVEFTWNPPIDHFRNSEFPGVESTRSPMVGIELGNPIKMADPAGTGFHLVGYGGGTVSNHWLGSGSARLTATCTKNVEYAVRID